MAATYDDVAAIVATLPGATEGERHGGRTWLVNDKVFAWERGYSKADLKRFDAAGETPPKPPLLAVRTADLDDKEAMLAAGHRGFFTIEHFANYPGFLIEMKAVGKRALKEAVVDAWLVFAPTADAEAYLGRRRT
jgi:hypothetical protein